MPEMLFTVKEVSSIIKSDKNFVYDLIKKGLLPALKLGSYKVRKQALEDFLVKYEGKDLSNLDHIVELGFGAKGVN